jgi:hypothetical protein
MHELPQPPLRQRVLSWLPFVASAAFAAFSVQVALNAPLAAAGLAALALLVFLPQLINRRRVRKLLLSGDVEAVLALWRVVLENVPHRETMAPLFTATALAANGMTERARAELARAVKGDAWDAAIEHRLFVETLLDAFEGQRLDAVAKAEKLSLLPLPPVGPFVRDRVAGMRAAAGALARAFAHSPKQGDLGVLESAARRNPIVHWAMRYAAAVACIDRGDHRAARRFLTGAPLWPEDSAFRDFHAELAERVDAPGVSAVR